MVSRSQVAQAVAGRLGDRRQRTLREVAAWLVATGRAREARYLARDVADTLLDGGYAYVRVTTARPLGEGARKDLVRYLKEQLGAKTIELEAAVDASVIGGVRVETPAATLDATVRAKLSRYVEGVTN